MAPAQEPTRPELDPEDQKLLGRGTKLGKVARYTGNALNIMLTVLKEASSGVPILRPVAGSALAALETVQMMDDNHSLIAQVLVDIVETTYVVTLALKNSDEGQEQIVEQKLSMYITTFEAKLEGIHESLLKLLQPKAGLFSRITQVKGYKNKINDLHEALKKERGNLHLLISALTYRGIVCKLPIDPEELKEYAGKQAKLQLQDWQKQQSENPNGVLAGPGAVVNSQVGHMTAKKARGNAVGTKGTIVTGDNFKGSNTLYNITRGDDNRKIRIGTVGNYHDGDVYGTMNQGCNNMYFSPSHQSQEPVAQQDWQQQQYSHSPPTQPEWQQGQWPQGEYPPQHQPQWSYQ